MHYPSKPLYLKVSLNKFFRTTPRMTVKCSLAAPSSSFTHVRSSLYSTFHISYLKFKRQILIKQKSERTNT